MKHSLKTSNVDVIYVSSMFADISFLKRNFLAKGRSQRFPAFPNSYNLMDH